MRKRQLVIAGVAALVVAAAAVAAWAALRAREQPEWTTSSPAALAEMRLGLDAQRKYYSQEARAHYEKALELDPDFAIAKRMLMRTDVGKERREALGKQLAAVDRSRLTPREAFLIEHTLARSADAPSANADKIVEDYLRRYPRDPYALEMQADLCWNARRWDDAERTFQKLLEIDPNWLDAQNKMGYLSMGLGRFAEAEDRFRTYRFVAPDQANPHDSLGELLVLIGRLDEAQRELEAALRIRPDFCSSYHNLSHAARLSGHPERVPALTAALEKNRCGAEMVAISKCWDRIWNLYLARDWKPLAATFHEPCIQKRYLAPILPHLAAVLDGDLALARQIEAFVAKGDSNYITRENPAVPHTAAIREIAEGDLAKALDHFAAVDAQIQYRTVGDGIFKMYNRLQWARTLEASGDSTGAERLVREVAAVNKAMAARYTGLPAPRPTTTGDTASAATPAAGVAKTG